MIILLVFVSKKVKTAPLSLPCQRTKNTLTFFVAVIKSKNIPPAFGQRVVSHFSFSSPPFLVQPDISGALTTIPKYNFL